MKRKVILLPFIAFAFGQTINLASAALVEYSAGHADVRPLYQDGDLSLAYRFDTLAVLDGVANLSPTFEPLSDAYVRVPDTTAETFPAAFPTFFPFLGSPIPSPVYILPQNNVPGEPFFGFSSEELTSSDWSGGGGITYSLSAFSGPGNFALFQTSGLSNSVKWQTSDGIDGTDAFTPPLGHDHYSWAFTQLGVYELTITASGTHVTDGSKSTSETFFFSVGDTTPAPVPEPGTLLLTLSSVAALAFRRRKPCCT